MLEDQPADVELARRALRDGGINFMLKRVKPEATSPMSFNGIPRT